MALAAVWLKKSSEPDRP